VLKTCIGTDLGADVELLVESTTGIPSDRTRSAGTMNMPVAHGELPTGHCEIAYGVGIRIVSCPLTRTLELVTSGVASPPSVQRTVAPW
jgi:hypothetical protein